MGRKRWTNPEELQFLIDRQPEYHAGQRNKKLGDFYDGTMAAFVQAFPDSFMGLGGPAIHSEGKKMELSAVNLESGRNVRVLLFVNRQRASES